MVLYLYVVDAKKMTYPHPLYQVLHCRLPDEIDNLQYGCYQLIFTLNKSKDLTVGRLGKLTFLRGFYIYTGRHKNRLTKRIYRHLNPLKKIHWHVDYLTTDTDFKLCYFLIYPERLFECQLHQQIKNFCMGYERYKGFGNSDCKEGCLSHLIYFDTYSSDFFYRWVDECSTKNISILIFDNSEK